RSASRDRCRCGSTRPARPAPPRALRASSWSGTRMAQTVVAMQTWLSPAPANRYNSVMRRLLFVVWGLAGGLLSLSCAATPAFTSQHLADGSYQLQCATALSSCLDRVDEVCRGTPYDVVSAHDHRRSTDITVGTAKSEVRSSEAIIRCT